MSIHDQLDQNQIFWFQPLRNLFSIIKWPVCHRMATHSQSFLPHLMHFSMCVICVHVKAFPVIGFASHQDIMRVVLCMHSARHCLEKKALNPIWLSTIFLSPGILK